MPPKQLRSEPTNCGIIHNLKEGEYLVKTGSVWISLIRFASGLHSFGLSSNPTTAENTLRLSAVSNESAFVPEMPEWNKIDLSWAKLRSLPTRWKSALREWRGIYFIFDTSRKMGYVGAAYGKSNILGRWENYAASGHGGNRLLKKCNPKDLRFSILQRVSPDMSDAEILPIENSWKERLHTRHPFGLNDN
jgi:hypothetical protein